MADRASHLSKVLITRLISLEMALLDDAAPSEGHDERMRRDLVAKVLATELGVTDEASISKVAEFLPRIFPGTPVPDREYLELAELLRTNLPLD